MHRRLSRLLFVVLLALYLMTLGGQFFISDGVAMYLTTASLVEYGTIAVAPNPGLPQLIEGHDGQTYSMYDLGQPIAAIPFYYFGRLLSALFPDATPVSLSVFSVSLLPQIATALAGVVLFRIVYRLFGDEWKALLISLLWGSGTLAFPYARFYFPEALLTLCLLLSFYGLLHERKPIILVLSGLALGYAFAVRASAVIYAVPLMIYLLSDIWGKSDSRKQVVRIFVRQAVYLVLGFLPFVLLFFWHNQARFGGILSTGYSTQGFTTPFIIGFYGLLFSSGCSIFLYSPLVLLGLISLRSLGYDKDTIYRVPTEKMDGGEKSIESHRPLVYFIVALFVTAVLFFSTWWTWHGGWSWGPRFLVPIIPFLLIPIAPRLASPRFRGVVILVWVLSLFVVIPGVFVDFNEFIATTIQGDYQKENLIWFNPRYSPILNHWMYLFEGRALTIRSFRLSGFGFPPFFDVCFFPVTFLCFGLTLFHIRRIFIRRNLIVQNR